MTMDPRTRMLFKAREVAVQRWKMRHRLRPCEHPSTKDREMVEDIADAVVELVERERAA